jgi:hypothetical protein
VVRLVELDRSSVGILDDRPAPPTDLVFDEDVGSELLEGSSGVFERVHREAGERARGRLL